LATTASIRRSTPAALSTWGNLWLLRWPRLRNWPGKRLRDSLCRDLVGELGRDLGMGRSIK